MLDRLFQHTIEDKYAKKHNKEKILKDISNLSTQIDRLAEVIEVYSQKEYYESKTIRLARIRAMDKRELAIEVIANLVVIKDKQPIQAISGILAGHLKYEDILDGIKTSAELIALSSKIGLCKIIRAADSETGSLLVSSKYKLEPETLDKIELTKFLPPMICKPDKVNWNNQSAYLTFDDSIILGKQTFHTEKLCLDVINIQNAIPLELDERLLEYPELSSKPLDTPEKIENHERMVRTSKIVTEELVNQGNRFYLTNKPDSRGRFYSMGYHVNIQGSKYKRSLISFADKEVIR